MKFILIFFCICSCTVMGQTSKEQLEVTYTYNFARNVTWPNEANFRSFHITVFGGNRELLNRFKKLSQAVRLKGSPIIVKQIDKIADLPRTELVFIAKDKHGQIPDLFDKVEGKPVLLVTHAFNNKRLVMINLIEKNRQISFEINKANIINNRLQTKPELVLSGGTEIDVAKLFREGQDSLNALERLVRKQQTQLTSLKENIKQSEALLVKHKEQIKAQQNDIDDQAVKLKNQQGTMKLQGQRIKVQQAELLSRRKSLDQLETEINDSRAELLNKTAKNTELKEGLTKLNTEIGSSRETIAKQETQIKEQGELLAAKIAERDKLINDINTKVLDLTSLKGEFDKQKGEVKKREFQINEIRSSISNSMKVLDSQKEKIDSQNATLKKQGETIAT